MQIRTWVGLDVGKSDHHATVLSAAGEVVLDRGVRNDEAAIERLLTDAGEEIELVIDQPGSIGALAVAVARRRGVPVAYVPGLVMRRASQLYPGEAKTDRRDSFVIADTARIHQARVHWLGESEELLDELRVLGGHDDDLAHDRTRTANRLRDLLLQASPAVEQPSAPRPTRLPPGLDHPDQARLAITPDAPAHIQGRGQISTGKGVSLSPAPTVSPRLIPDHPSKPGFDLIVPFRHVTNGVRSRSPSWPVPAALNGATFPQRSPPRLLTAAACGGLQPPPEGRLRRTTSPTGRPLHLRYSTAPIDPEPLLRPLVTFRVHTLDLGLLIHGQDHSPRLAWQRVPEAALVLGLKMRCCDRL